MAPEEQMLFVPVPHVLTCPQSHLQGFLCMPLISFVSLSAFSTPKVVVRAAWGLDSTGTILNQKEIGFGR